MKYLFLGGEIDGRRIDVPEPAPEFYKIPILNIHLSTYEVYQRQFISAYICEGQESISTLYVIEGMSSHNMIRKLVEGYTKS